MDMDENENEEEGVGELEESTMAEFKRRSPIRVEGLHE